jgi:hypothetical protein
MRVFATRDHKDHKEILSAIRAVEKLCRPSLRAESAAAALSARNPTAYTALAVCCAAAQFFISYLRVFAFICG